MPEFTKYPPGHFCWAELNTTDVKAARGFYGELFGWKMEDMPMPSGSYTIATVGGKHVAGLTTLPEQAAKMGVPPHWAAYVAVEDVAKTAAAAKTHGGKVLVDATPMGPGTFAVIEDPTGAKFLLWNTTQPMASMRGEAGGVAWNELISTDPAKALAFYDKLFGWRGEAFDMPSGKYTVLKKGDAQIGGLMAQPDTMKGAPSMWATYFEVADADATFARAAKLGAKVLMPLVDVPTVGRFGWLKDPQGVAVAVLKGESKKM